jgi:hypothetical protein
VSGAPGPSPEGSFLADGSAADIEGGAASTDAPPQHTSSTDAPLQHTSSTDTSSLDTSSAQPWHREPWGEPSDPGDVGGALAVGRRRGVRLRTVVLGLLLLAVALSCASWVTLDADLDPAVPLIVGLTGIGAVLLSGALRGTRRPGD